MVEYSVELRISSAQNKSCIVIKDLMNLFEGELHGCIVLVDSSEVGF